MWANGHAKLGGHEEDGQDLGDAGKGAAVDRADIDGCEGKQKMSVVGRKRESRAMSELTANN